MNIAPIDPSIPIIGQSLLPEGRELADYLSDIQEDIRRALSDHRIEYDPYINFWLVSECLNAAGWKTRVECLSALIKHRYSGDSRMSSVYYLLLDDQTAFLQEGTVGMDAIKAWLDEQMRKNLRLDAKCKSLGNHPGPIIELRLLDLPAQWFYERTAWHKNANKQSLELFHQHPGSHHIVQSVVSAIIASRLDQDTASTSKPSSRHRL